MNIILTFFISFLGNQFNYFFDFFCFYNFFLTFLKFKSAKLHTHTKIIHNIFSNAAAKEGEERIPAGEISKKIFLKKTNKNTKENY